MKILLVAALASMPVLAGSGELLSAIKSGQRVAAIAMLAHPRDDVNAAEADGSTPLLWAANLNDADLVLRLLKAGAKVDVANRYGATPMQMAATVANTEILKLLIDAGASADFDRHVADCQPPFDAERPDRRAGIFDDVA